MHKEPTLTAEVPKAPPEKITMADDIMRRITRISVGIGGAVSSLLYGNKKNKGAPEIEKDKVWEYISKRFDAENETRRNIHEEMDKIKHGKFKLTEQRDLNQYVGTALRNFSLIGDTKLKLEMQCLGANMLISPQISHIDDVKSLMKNIQDLYSHRNVFFGKSDEVGVIEILLLLYKIYNCPIDAEEIAVLISESYRLFAAFSVPRKAIHAKKSRGDAISLLLGDTEDFVKLMSQLKCTLEEKYTLATPKENAREVRGGLDSPYIAIEAYIRKHNFPEIQKVTGIPEIDPHKPVVTIGNYDGNSLSIARELDRLNKVNIILYTSDTAIVLQYKDGKILYFELSEQEKKELDEKIPHTHYTVYMGASERAAAMSNFLTEKILKSKSFTMETLVKHNIPTSWNTANRVNFQEKGKRSADFDKAPSEEEYNQAIVSATLKILEATKHKSSGKIVIKPSGTSGGHKVAIFDLGLASLAMAAEHIVNIQLELEMDVIIEDFVEPLPLTIKGQEVDWNLRVLITRDEKGNPMIDDMPVRIGEKNSAVNICNGANVLPFEVVMEHLKLSEDEKKEVMQKIQALVLGSVHIIEKIQDEYFRINQIRSKYNRFGFNRFGTKFELIDAGPYQPQNDLYGIDIIITKGEDGKPTPVIIEVNGGNSGGIWKLDDALPEAERGRPCRNLAKRIAQRAQEEYELMTMMK